MSTTLPISESSRETAVYTAAEAQTLFTFDFPIQAAEDLYVFEIDATTGGEIPFTLTTDYTVSGVGETAGGSVTFLTGRTAGDKIQIRGLQVIQRVTDVTQSGKFRSVAFEYWFDRIFMGFQEFRRDIQRALVIAASPPGSGLGDMLRATYDPDDDGKVTAAQTADNVAWSGITSKPTTLTGFGILDQIRHLKDLVLDYGADPTGATNSDVALLAAITAGQPVTAPVGTFKFANNYTATNKNNFAIIGSGAFDAGTIFEFAQPTGDNLVFNNCQHFLVTGVWFRPTVRRTSGFDIKVTGGGFRGVIRENRFDYGYNSIWIEHATETDIIYNTFRFRLGTENILFGGAATLPEASYRAVITDNRFDNPYPVSSPGAGDVITRSDVQNVTLGQVAKIGNYTWQCVQAGETGAGTAPSTPGGSTAAEAFEVSVADGGVLWKAVSRIGLAHITQDSYGYSMSTARNAMLNGDKGVVMRSIVSPVDDSRPKWMWLDMCEFDHCYEIGLDLDRGEGVFSNMSWIGSTLNNNGVRIGPDFTGEVDINGGRIVGNAENGILREAGPKDIKVRGASIGANGQKASDTYHGIAMAAGSDGTHITDNRIGLVPSIGSEAQANAINAGAGCTDVVCTGNNLRGNLTAAIAGLAAGPDVILDNNLT